MDEDTGCLDSLRPANPTGQAQIVLTRGNSVIIRACSGPRNKWNRWTASSMAALAASRPANQAAIAAAAKAVKSVSFHFYRYVA
jgi:hypothetical protein